MDITSFACIFKSELHDGLEAHMQKMKEGLSTKNKTQEQPEPIRSALGAKDQNEVEPENTLPPYTPSLTRSLSLLSLKKKGNAQANRETKIRDEGGYSLGQMEEVTDDRRKANDLTPTLLCFLQRQ